MSRIVNLNLRTSVLKRKRLAARLIWLDKWLYYPNVLFYLKVDLIQTSIVTLTDPSAYNTGPYAENYGRTITTKTVAISTVSFAEKYTVKSKFKPLGAMVFTTELIYKLR